LRLEGTNIFEKFRKMKEKNLSFLSLIIHLFLVFKQTK